MKFPPINCYKLLTGRYRFYLPDVDNPKQGVSYDENEYVAAFLLRHGGAQDPRCGDPRCPNRFVPKRVVQRYCSPACKNKHASRARYAVENGTTGDESSVIAPTDVASILERELRAAMQDAKRAVDARPQMPLPRLLPENLQHLHKERDAAEARAKRDAEQRRMSDYAQFIVTLNARLRADGYKPGDGESDNELHVAHLWKDQQLDLLDAYRASQDQLPADLMPYLKS